MKAIDPQESESNIPSSENLSRVPAATPSTNSDFRPTKNSPKKENGKGPGGFLSFLFELGVILLIVWVIRSFIATPFQIEGSSMNDTLFNQDKIFVSRLFHYVGGIERGDIIVFKPPYFKMIPKSGPLCYIKQKLFPQ